MRILTSVLSLALCFGSISRAASSALPVAATGEAGRVFIVGLSPFLDSTVKDAVYRGMVRLIVEDVPLNTRLEVYDAFNLKSITRVSVPDAEVFHSPKTRANQFASAIGRT
jgi:hypothetical protein